jgi:hypothetical protein
MTWLVFAQAAHANPLYRASRNDWRFERMAARGEIARDQQVVVLSTASGLEFVDVKTASAAGMPVKRLGDYDAVRRALDTAVAA